MLFYLFLSDLSLLEQKTPGIYISPELFQVSYIPFRRILKLCGFSLNIERVGFVLRLLQNASPFVNPFFIPLVKSVYGPAIKCSINDFLRNFPYVNKDGGVVE